MQHPPFKAEALTYLMQFLTESRREKFLQVVAQRTTYLVPVVECLIDEQNVNAVIRSSENFGLQRICVIETDAKMKAARSISKGSHHWLDIEKYKRDRAADCIARLKQEGYKIFAASPHEGGFTPSNIPLDKKLAVVFGAEGPGISPQMTSACDGFLQIPMYGFTESYNISVAAAIALYTITEGVKQSAVAWQLTQEEQQKLLWRWTCRTIREAEKLLQRFPG